MKALLRQKAINLRLDQKLSYSAIKQKLGVPKSTLSYWLKNYPLSETQIKELKEKGMLNAEAGYERFRNSMCEKREKIDHGVYLREKNRLSKISKDSEYIAGLMLYLGEGEKTTPHRLILINTDYRIILFFIAWMKKFLNVSPKDIRLTLHLYENMDIKKEKLYWENKLGLPKSQFYKEQIRKLRVASFSYPGSFKHGTCSIYVGGVDRKRKVMMAIKVLLERLV